MAIAHDAISEATTAEPSDWDIEDPKNWTHTPTGTPRAVLVLISANTDTDQIAGVTYGGTSMTRIPTDGYVSVAGAEPGAVYAYFLGANVPTGAQTVSVDVSGTTNLKWGGAITMTAADNTEVVDSAQTSGAVDNPSVSTDSGTRTAARYCVLYSSASGPTVYTPDAGMTEGVIQDFGSQTGRIDRRTNTENGNQACSYTGGVGQSVAMVAVAIAELVAADASPLPILIASPVRW